MTEAAWLACSPHDINRMLNHLTRHTTERRLFLFVCGCCRRLWPLLHDERLRDAVESAERNADAAPPQPIPWRVSDAVWAAYCNAYRNRGKTWDEFEASARNSAAAAILCLASGMHVSVAHHASVAAKFWARSNRMAGRPAAKWERATCLQLLRCVFGNPFRPLSFSPEWRTDTAVSLARAMYEEREFSAMPILADALQDAGCDDPDILDHCRDTTLTHVRGCWAVDLVLNKS